MNSNTAEQAAPKRPGRKPLADGEGKTARVELRVLPETKAAWLSRATAAGLTLQAWIEQRCNAKR